MDSPKSDKFTLSPIHLFFLLYVSLVGAGLMDFQRYVSASSGQDGWIAVLAASLFVVLMIWMMYGILSRQAPPGANLVDVNRRYFGKAIGAALNVCFVVYFLWGAFVTLRFYLQVIEVWIFPEMNQWPLVICIFALLYYTVSGGIQTVAGICFWGTLSIFLFVLPQCLPVLPYLHPHNMTPVLDHSAAELFDSTRLMARQFLGCLVLMAVFPYIKEGGRSSKWSYGAAGAAAFIYILMLLLALMYFSPQQLKETVWPTLSVVSIIHVPLMQRLEYVVLNMWLLKMVSNISVGLWAACHSLKQQLRIRPRISLAGALIGFLILFYLVDDPGDTRRIISLYMKTGEYLVFAYIPIVFVISRFSGKTGTSQVGK
ncbi:Spore germination protein YndE [Cohnella sp. JJ-181]|nr:GerAB/ArcD/ProY family transporter [Cohnella sp. JJ-181]CAI6085926.1 Spore germination protein YndE [Cohnella sp. JJ-181]